MNVVDFRLTRFQFARDRVIGDSQVRADDVNVAALELIDDRGNTGLGFVQTLFRPLPALAEINRTFRDEVWPGLDRPAAGGYRSPGQPPARRQSASHTAYHSTKRCR